MNKTNKRRKFGFTAQQNIRKTLGVIILSALTMGTLVILDGCKKPGMEPLEQEVSMNETNEENTESPDRAPVAGQIVRTFEARTIKHLKGRSGSGIISNIRVPAADEYYLDYTVTFVAPFDWVPNGRPRGGKLPGLAGGTGTGNCNDVVKNGWSARQTWDDNGTCNCYLYHQDRNSGCGDKIDWINPNGTKFQFKTNRAYRITQRVKINTPNQKNGINQIWVDGVQVHYKSNVCWRGAVAKTEARVDMVKYHSYFGGNEPFAPAYDCYTKFGTMYLQTYKPNFSKAPGAPVSK